MKLYEILVPTQFNDGRPIRAKYHRIWDDKVRAVTNGLTVFKPARGQWQSPEGELFRDRNIPVRIACSELDIEKIIAMTAEHYEQLAIMAYVISEEVLIRDTPKDVQAQWPIKNKLGMKNYDWIET